MVLGTLADAAPAPDEAVQIDGSLAVVTDLATVNAGSDTEGNDN